MFSAVKELWLTIKLIIRADVAFAMASRGEDERALRYLTATEVAFGPLTKCRFGIEPMLLMIFLKGCLFEIAPDDYDWVRLRESILSAPEYNPAEKLHLLIYLEEFATTAGVSLSIPNQPVSTEDVSRRLKRRFPKLSEA